MADPEDVLIDAGLLASGVISRLWRQQDAERRAATDGWLDDQRARLQLLITAIFERDIPVRVAQPPAPPSFLSRLLRPLPTCLRQSNALPATDGIHIFLPRRLQASQQLSPSRWFRLLALQQAARACRGTAAHVQLPAEGLTHQLYLIREAASVDQSISRELPGLTADLRAARAAMLAARPPLAQLTPQEQALERLYRELLQNPASDCLELDNDTPLDSWSWAQRMSQEITKRHPGRFRGMLPDRWLGLLRPAPLLEPSLLDASEDDDASPPTRPKIGQLLRRPEARLAPEDENDPDPGMWMLQMDDPLEHVEDPMGMQRPTDRDAGKNPDDTADSLSELPQARLVSTPERAKEIFVSDDPPDTRSIMTASKQRVGISYPEWDYRQSAYLTNGATVWIKNCSLGDPAWAEELLERRRPLFEQVRRRFEGLRPRRILLKRQQD